MNILSINSVLLLPLILYHVVHSKELIIRNQCDDPVWPVAKSNSDGTPWLLPTTTGGFVLQPGQSNTMYVPPSWSGSLWGRTQCNIEDSGAFHCLTGDCGSYKVGCGSKSDLLKPASTSIASFTLNATDGMDYYEVSFKNGYNLPLMVAPVDRGRVVDDEHHCTTAGCAVNLISFKNGYNLPLMVAPVDRGRVVDDEHHCTTAGCAVNLISSCPPELRYSDESLGCKSACQAFAEPSFCCSTAAACNCSHNRYTDFFKQACPKANSFANDKTSTFSCPLQQDFVIIFCPSSSTTRSTSPDYNLHTESESDSQGKINNNSKKRNKYKMPALISGALALLGTLSTALWWFNAAGSTNCCQINFFFNSLRIEGIADVAFRREGDDREIEREGEIEIAVAESDVENNPHGME
ncbi:thaumatin-like protein 1 [Ziziphus jujuba]|uniref:Thaumatin-like protein 1 n=1 Tax=Ziziphus jujuba TaxID=326968 RepID=A0ABM4A218_ZIZJJ|nr:thaumatin-like protein 1 [Ziziphus jujuba]